MALAGSAAAPAVGAPPAPRLQRPAPAQRPPTCAAAHPHVRTIAAGQPGWRASGGGGVAAAAPRRRLQQPRRAARLAARAAGGGGQGPWGERQQRKLDNQILLGAGLGLTLLVLVALKLGAVEGADAWQLGAGDVSFGAGDAFGGALWGASLYFTSPIQLLLLFFGFIETERPSDWVLRRLGLAAGLDVDALDYRVPPALRAATAALFGSAGFAVAFALEALLGDATWAVSTGLGSCFGAAMYEVGRPRRLTVEEAQAKESQWQDFARFADARLQRSGRCHESEILKALQREMPQFRREGALDGNTLRQLVRNWHPDADRSSNGFYKGISLVAGGGADIAPRAASSTGSASSVDQY